MGGAFDNLIGSFGPKPETRLPPEEKPIPKLEPVGIDGALQGLASSGLFATPTKLWLTSVLGDKSDITESDFKDEEMATLRRVVGENLQNIAGRTEFLGAGSAEQQKQFRAELSKSFTYDGYFVGGDTDPDRNLEPTEEIYNLQRSLGEFALRRDADDNVVIRDWYDFHYPDFKPNHLDLGRRLGQAAVPGGSGRVIRINLGPASQFGDMGQSIPLESDLPFPDAEVFDPPETPVQALTGSFFGGENVFKKNLHGDITSSENP